MSVLLNGISCGECLHYCLLIRHFHCVFFLGVGLKEEECFIIFNQCGRLPSCEGQLIGSTLRSQSSWRDGRSFRTSFQEEAWKRYNRRMQEEYEEEMERVERIRRMQSVFNRERNKFKRSYESWQENGPGAFHQNSQRNDWYWKADTSYRNHGSNYRENPQARASTPLSHHYSVLGLDRLRTKAYTDDEIKSAFRVKAKEFHPDQNQDRKEFAEAKFKEVMVSYEAIKSERKNNGRQ